MNALMPWRRRTRDMFEGFRDEMDHVMKRFFGGPLEAPDGAVEAWSPSCDVSETDKELIVKADLPGVDPKDVEISVNEGCLILRGEKKEEKEETNKNYHRVERFVGSFYREIPLPEGTDPERITATSANGTITVTIPRRPGVVPRKIAVTAAK